jgi:hypothetical protein
MDATGQEETPIRLVQVESAADTTATGFAWSPTVLVDGQDLFRGAAPVVELTCRLYPTAEGMKGRPTFDAFLEALSRLSPVV